ncbi:uncharacterized protein igsf9b isoform X1 [Brienomyrus brachyistius]|uniref:uncharacterized protein igsf9b isoform X1 n=2 Tax=Brienomyrus brachyistius TaxID=42636 RepID=UPI0020B3EAF2|nr:uncharacterized protein igsf9b isoform X1 [Brienomyrus brachyistius]XP_048845411.1 uncharacterized protein igsf9b isoform X1 [Brienomyrus brachyistius]
MGPGRLWLLGVTAATLVCLLRRSQGADSLVHGRLGGAAELGCSLAPPSASGPAQHLFPLHVVEWVRLGYNVPILIKFGEYTPRVHPDYKGRVALNRGASLLVQDLRLEDEGWFECRILMLDRATDEFRNGTWNFLSITAPPVFVKTPALFLEALQGDSLMLTCSAHGNPRPTVTWEKDGTPVERQYGLEMLNGSLSLAPVTREVSGMYKCHVYNSEGNLTHTTQLLVKGPPIIIIPPEDTIRNMSQDAVLRCQAEAYPANLSYVWAKEGENVYHWQSLKSRVKVLVDGSLLIPNLVPEDAGNYTCVPSNGLLTPPSASAYLTVKHPAQVVRMPRETYLPAGMGGVISCPVRAEPPMLYVNWTKDGDVLDLDMYPGWMVNSEGSVFVATANDNAVGVYTCTAYNSYGTMGRSDPTSVVLQDPPSFKVTPRAEYLQEVGRDLLIPCQANGDPVPNITWSKVGPVPRSPYTVAANGSLVLHPVSKNHQGEWECHATNRVASTTTSTILLVLGTSPHGVSSVSIIPGVHEANVSWEPGFDGGYIQKFSVWLKQASRRKHEWTSLPVPPSNSSFLVTGLLPDTSYQFSILPQNKLGSGPFSEIITVKTLVPPTDPPIVVTSAPKLPPPSFLLVNQTSKGILLQWVPPPPQSPPITGFMLQARQEKSQWGILNEAISGNSSEILVQGLLKDSIYELRLLSLRNEVVGEPSESVNVSTVGMEIYPAQTSLLDFIPEPMLAGVVGGVCFLFVAIILSLVTACIMNHRREKRRRRRRDDLPTALQKSPPPEAGTPTDSPDSVLKMKLCPPLSFFPGSSASQSVRSSFDKGSRSEYQDQRQQLLSSSSPPPRYTLFESHFGGQPPPALALESISRGPDGRFIVQPYEDGSTPAHIKRSLKRDFPQCTADGSGSGSAKASEQVSPRSDLPSYEKEEKEDRPVVLSVDIPGDKQSQQSPGRVKAMGKNFSQHGCFYSDDEQGCSEGLLDQTSFYSDSSEIRACDSLKKYSCRGNPFQTLRNQARNVEQRQDRRRYDPSNCLPTGPLRSKTDWKRESNSLNKCLKLAQERKEMEKELERYTSSRDAQEKMKEPQKTEMEAEEEPVWKLQDITLRPKSDRGSRLSDNRKGCYFGNTSSPMVRTSTSSSYIHWDISPVSSVTGLVPVQSPAEKLPLMSQWSASPAAEENSTVLQCSQSPATQCTQLSLLSPDLGGSPMFPGDLKGSKSRCPERRSEVEEESICRRLVPEEAVTKMISKKFNLEETDERVTNSDRGNLHSCPAPTCHEQVKLSQASVSLNTEREPQKSFGPYMENSNSTLKNTGDRAESKDSDRERSESSTLPYDLRKAGERAGEKAGQNKACDKPSVSPLSPESEMEGVRTRSRKSDKCLYSDSPSCVSPLTLTENETDQSSFSLARMSDSYKTLHQTSAILEYLSLPGFVEMSVDDPVDENSTSASSEQRSGNLLREEPDVVLKHWEVHDSDREVSKQCTVILENNFLETTVQGSGQEDRRFSVLKLEDSTVKEMMPDKSPRQLASLQEQGEQVYCERSQTHLTEIKSTLEVQKATKSALAITATDAVSNAPDPLTKRQEPVLPQTQRCETQDYSANNVAARRYPPPVHFMKKSLSMGPSRSSYTARVHCPQLKKSTSLGSQRWEHSEIPQNYSYEKHYQDEFLHPDVKIKSLSLGRSYAHSSSSRQSQFHQESVPFRPQSRPDLKSSPLAKMSLTSPSQLAVVPLAKDPQSQPYPLASGRAHYLDPRRQATALPDASRWPVTHHDALRSVQHRTALHEYPAHQMPPRPAVRRDYLRPPDSKQGLHRAFLPRGYSWPSPYTAPFAHRESEWYMGREAELDVRECRDGKEGRASYASQSSGRGSMGPCYTQALLRQSLSLTPTLASSPETTEETKRHSFMADMLKSRPTKRGNTSVDESYEWDEVDFRVDSNTLGAASATHSYGGQGGVRGERLRGQPHSAVSFRELQSKDMPALPHLDPFARPGPPMPPPPRGPYGHSLTEARFNALRLEYQEYRRAQESSFSHGPHLIPDPDSDPDSNTALL